MGFSTLVNLSHTDEQYDKLVATIKANFGDDSERTLSLLKLYEDFAERIKEAPASGRVHYHNAYEGGYLDHIFNVLDCALEMAKLYKNQGGVIDFTKEELVFTALHHDLGKLGTLDDPYYVIQDSDWHRKNKNEAYKHNEDAQYMTVNDRTIFLLQQYGVKLTQNEYLALKLTDGLYDKANEAYLKQYGAGYFPMRTNLHKIMHWADHMAASIENDPVRQKFTR
jgi:hypothetical protein